MDKGINAHNIIAISKENVGFKKKKMLSLLFILVLFLSHYTSTSLQKKLTINNKSYVLSIISIFNILISRLRAINIYNDTPNVYYKTALILENHPLVRIESFILKAASTSFRCYSVWLDRQTYCTSLGVDDNATTPTGGNAFVSLFRRVAHAHQLRRLLPLPARSPALSHAHLEVYCCGWTELETGETRK